MEGWRPSDWNPLVGSEMIQMDEEEVAEPLALDLPTSSTKNPEYKGDRFFSSQAHLSTHDPLDPCSQKKCDKDRPGIGQLFSLFQGW